MGMRDVFRDVVTTKDGVTHDLGRWSWVLSFAAVVISAIANGLAGHEVVNPKELAESLAIVAGANAAALWAKQGTEPKPPEPPKDPS